MGLWEAPQLMAWPGRQLAWAVLHPAPAWRAGSSGHCMLR